MGKVTPSSKKAIGKKLSEIWKPALQRYRKAFAATHRPSDELMQLLDEPTLEITETLTSLLHSGPLQLGPTNSVIASDFLLFLDTQIKDSKESKEVGRQILASGYDWSSPANARLLCELATSVKLVWQNDLLAHMLFSKAI